MMNYKFFVSQQQCLGGAAVATLRSKFVLPSGFFQAANIRMIRVWKKLKNAAITGHFTNNLRFNKSPIKLYLHK